MIEQPPRTWAEMTQPTAEQLVEWVRAHNTEQLPLLVPQIGRLLEAAARGELCVQANHGEYPAQIRFLHASAMQYRDEARRYRLAWASACRRGVWRLSRTTGVSYAVPVTTDDEGTTHG